LNAIDREWVEVSADHLPAAQLHAQLQTRRNALFGSAEPRMQVIQQMKPTGTVVYLHMLNEPVWGNRALMSHPGKK